ncbi:MAG: phosphoglycerate kinase [Francisellaceae bacterium]
MQFLKITDVDLKGKKVLIRVDFNVPLKNGHITSTTRIEAALKTIRYAIDQGSRIMLLSHLGRPVEGQYDEQFSLAPVADCLGELLGQKVDLAKDWLKGIDVAAGQVVLCENVRFNKGEKKNDEALARHMASLCDVFVMDAFATAHRAEGSTYGIAQFAPIACAGFLLSDEIEALSAAIAHPKKPLVAIVGGAKVSTKLTVLKNLIDKVDTLIVGGGIANTFLVAAGFSVGKSLMEADLVDEARELMAYAKAHGIAIPMPVDVRVAKVFDENAEAEIKTVEAIEPDDLILDIGPMTQKQFSGLLHEAKTILWNGPVGVFEFDNFSAGTKAISEAIASSSAFSVAGGGDTIAAIEKFNIKDKVSYISTAGGAFLEFIEGKTLPAVDILCKRSDEVAS